MKQTGLNKPNQLERITSLEKNAETLSMGVRVSQMLVQQMLQRVTQLEERLAFVVSSNNDLQYRLLALQKVTGVDLNALQTEADRLKLEEWNQASADDNVAKGLVAVESVSGPETTVVFTSTTPSLSEDRGIFRSKVKVSEIGTAQAIEVFQDKKPGDKFELTLNGQIHLVELLEVLELKK
jgi:hypothetical protein